MKKALLIFNLFLLLGIPIPATAGHPDPALCSLPITAHAHNDYQHEHPLWDALHMGFSCIEADVCLEQGTFYVAHDTDEIIPSRTLSSLYFDPLVELLNNNGGHVFQDGTEIILLIDIKTDATQGWLALQELLDRNEDLRKGSVRILVSGNRDLQAMNATHNCWAQYDGRLADLQDHPEMPIIPLISANWTEEFDWIGQGSIPAKDLLKLRNIISAAQAQGRKVRFWATDVPDSRHQGEMWKRLLAEDVDFICTDKLEALRDFMNKQDEE